MLRNRKLLTLQNDRPDYHPKVFKALKLAGCAQVARDKLYNVHENDHLMGLPCLIFLPCDWSPCQLNSL